MVAKLTLIRCNDTSVVALSEAAEALAIVRVLRSEARSFEAVNGKNPYSDYILKHGCRPPQAETAGMARMMRMRLKAADGSWHPKRSGNAARRKAAREAARAEGRKREQLKILVSALRDLAGITEEPEGLLAMGNAEFEQIVGRCLGAAVRYLHRIKDEWQRHEPQAAHDGTAE